jgi:hypothetical protein
MSSRPHDTTPEAWATHRKVLNDMGGARRLQAALDLSDTVRAIRIAGIRARHPGESDAQVVRRLVLAEYGIRLPDPM